MSVDLIVKDHITSGLHQIAKMADNFKPVAARIEREILKPLRTAEWSKSGLQSQTGALLRAITTWHGEKSAGVTLKAKGGRNDVGRIFAKATTHTSGAKKFSFKQGYHRSKKGTRKKSYIIKAKRRSPWGDIPARQFFPEEQDLQSKKPAIIEMIKEHLQNA